MNLRKLSRAIAVTGVAVTVGLAASTSAHAQKRVKWKMQSTWSSSLAHLGESGARFSKDIDRLSGGKFQIKFFEPGALVPALECFDAASKGSVEACWTTPGYHTGKLGAGVAFFTAVPFGPQLGEYLAWKWFGGGNDVPRRSVRQARSDGVRFPVHRPGDLRLVPGGDQERRRAARLQDALASGSAPK